MFDYLLTDRYKQGFHDYLNDYSERHGVCIELMEKSTQKPKVCSHSVACALWCKYLKEYL